MQMKLFFHFFSVIVHKLGTKRTLFLENTGYNIVPLGLLVLLILHIEKSYNPPTPKKFREETQTLT